MKNNKEEIINKLSVHIADELEEVRKNNNKIEMIEKTDVLFNIHKILMNYDELEPILKKYFSNKKRKECKHEDNFCNVEKMGCQGCYYEEKEI